MTKSRDLHSWFSVQPGCRASGHELSGAYSVRNTIPLLARSSRSLRISNEIPTARRQYASSIMSSVTLLKKSERLKLARKIESLGLEMSPCSRCKKQNRKCVVDPEQSTRCAECIRQKCSCDALQDDWERNVPRMSDWDAIEKQKALLEEQEEEAMAKILRLRKQKKFLVRREAEMSRRGLKFLDELDAAEEKERVEKEALEAAASSAAPADASAATVDPPFDPVLAAALAAYDPSDPYWATLGFDGGTLPTSQGS